MAELDLELECEVFEEEEDEEDSSSSSGSSDEDDGEIGEMGDDENSADDTAGRQNIIEPYQHEPAPRPRNDDEPENNGDAPREIDQARLFSTDWCECGRCEVLPSFNAGDCLCCREIQEVVEEAERVAVMAETEVECITLADNFEAAILNPLTLYIGWMHFTEKWRRTAKSFAERNNEKYRYVAYRSFVRWCWGFLGKDIRVQLPACVQAKIKNSYPDGAGHYKGTVLRPLHV